MMKKKKKKNPSNHQVSEQQQQLKLNNKKRQQQKIISVILLVRCTYTIFTYTHCVYAFQPRLFLHRLLTRRIYSTDTYDFCSRRKKNAISEMHLNSIPLISSSLPHTNRYTLFGSPLFCFFFAI